MRLKFSRERLRRLQSWPDLLMKTIIAALTAELLATSMLAGPVSFASSFSGMGTMEVALNILAAVAAQNGLHMESNILHSCDWDRTCQRLLAQHAPCVFKDVTEFTNCLKARFQGCKNYVLKCRLLKRVSLKRRAWCTKHKQNCFVPIPRLTGGGSPCTDHSKIGKRAGVNGDTVFPYLSWGRIASQSAVIVHENVRSFPDECLDDVCGDTHNIHKLLVSTADVGFGKQCRRDRVYHICVDKSITLLADPVELYEKVKLAFKGTEGRSHPGTWCCATKLELRTALQQRCKCPEAAACTCTFKSQLTSAQAVRLSKYQHLWFQKYGVKSSRDGRAVFHLGDDPDFRCVWATKDGAIPTIRKSMGPLWSAQLRRPILGRELMAAMGWFCEARTPGPIATIDYREFSSSLGRLVGNSMHLANVAAVLAVALAVVPQSSLQPAGALAGGGHFGGGHSAAATSAAATSAAVPFDELADAFDKFLEKSRSK